LRRNDTISGGVNYFSGNSSLPLLFPVGGTSKTDLIMSKRLLRGMGDLKKCGHIKFTRNLIHSIIFGQGSKDYH
jgi:hypothetical protein